MTLKFSFGENKASGSELSSSALSQTKRSLGKETLKDSQLSTSSFRSSSTAGLIRANASRSEATRITRSGFRDTNRVGRREDDPVYYRFTLRRSGRIDISIQNREAGGFFSFFTPSLQIRLERSNGRNIRSLTVEGGEFEHLARNLDRGTYYIRVTSGGESVPFRLGLRLRNGANLFR